MIRFKCINIFNIMVIKNTKNNKHMVFSDFTKYRRAIKLLRYITKNKEIRKTWKDINENTKETKINGVYLALFNSERS